MKLKYKAFKSKTRKYVEGDNLVDPYKKETFLSILLLIINMNVSNFQKLDNILTMLIK